MLTTERYPQTKNDWEYQAEDQKNWSDWNTSYKRVHDKARVKIQAAEGSENFGAANAADQFLKNSEVTMEKGGDKVVMKALERYFDNLAAAATNKKPVL